MKRALLAVTCISLISVACSAPFSNAPEMGDSAGAAGDTALAGSPADGAGAPGTGGSGAAGTGGKLTVGHGGKGGSAGSGATGGGTVAGTAGTGTPEAGAGGSSGGSAGSGTTAGAPGAGAAGAGATAGTGSVAPSCTSAAAFERAPEPSGSFTIDAWSNANAHDNVCWKQEAAHCTFDVDTWGKSSIDPSRERMFLKKITCDRPVYFGAGTTDSCTVQGDCNVFQGSDASVVAIDFDLAPSGDGYVATNMEKWASDAGGATLGCDISASTINDILLTSAEEFLSGMRFACSR